MPSYALAAIGRDRPGIVAAVARALFDHGCNVEDSSMTLLRGNFAIMLLFTAPPDASVTSLESAVGPVCAGMGLTSSVLEVEDRPSQARPSLVLTVYGADRPGILAGITAALADRGVNITDLNSRLVGSDEPVYALHLELELGTRVEGPALRSELEEIAAGLGVDISLQDLDTDVL